VGNLVAAARLVAACAVKSFDPRTRFLLSLGIASSPRYAWTSFLPLRTKGLPSKLAVSKPPVAQFHTRLAGPAFSMKGKSYAPHGVFPSWQVRVVSQKTFSSQLAEATSAHLSATVKVQGGEVQVPLLFSGNRKDFGKSAEQLEFLKQALPPVLVSTVHTYWNGTVLYCTVLYCYCTVLYCTVLYCTVLYR